MNIRFLAAAACAALLAACAATPAPSADPQDAFFANLQTLCGKTAAGRLTEGDPVLDKDFAENALTVGPVRCMAGRVEIPFAVGDDRSRTWIITRTPMGLRLKHRHAHGETVDALSNYGGDTVASGTAVRQEFPADAESKAMFVAQNRAVSVTNVWALEITPGASFAYSLRRPNRFVRVAFDIAP